MRLSYEQLEMIKERFGVGRLWSYSRISTYWDEPWIYRMQYLEGIRSDSNIYSHFGTISHDIIQEFYEGKHSYDKMSELFEDKLVEWRTTYSDLKFMNEKVERGYIENLRDYFKNTEVIPHKLTNETAICAHFPLNEGEEDIAFIGYLDSEYVDEDGILNIVDYKTSSMSGFTGAKLKEKSEQLKLYAIGINQFKGVPLDKIRLRFDMMKFYEVRYLQKNGKLARSKQERSQWVAGMTKKIQKELFNLDYDPLEVDDMMEMAVLNNSIAELPKEIQDKFSLHNCYIDVTITEEEAEELKDKIVRTVREIRIKEKGNWEVEFPEPKIDFSNRFFLEQLAPHLLPHHKRWVEEQKMLKGNDEVDDSDLLAMFT